jgi:uncharacterized protein YeaO (DUF488 family)
VAVRIVRLGEPRSKNEGLRLGTVRQPPRGVPKHDFATRNFFDAWLPELAPSPALVTWARKSPWTDTRWREFARRYRREMAVPQARHLIDALAALSHQANFAVGCYCEDSARCHRALLRELLVEAGATIGA